MQPGEAGDGPAVGVGGVAVALALDGEGARAIEADLEIGLPLGILFFNDADIVEAVQRMNVALTRWSAAAQDMSRASVLKCIPLVEWWARNV